MKRSLRSAIPVFLQAVFLAVFLATFSTSTASAAETTVQTALNSPKDQACRSAYQNLYGKGSANIRVVFGYKDTRPTRFVGDRHERLAFVQRILQPCKQGRQACGFTRSPENADHFFKTITGPNRQPVKIKLLVANSSVGSDDESNRENPLQKWQSSYAKTTFHAGIESADIVLYNGHSRFGGGPDFDPPRLDANGEVDPSHYKERRPGFEAIRDKLRGRRKAESVGNGLKVLGLFSCDSSQHFADEIAIESGTALISSRTLIYYSDALENSVAALSSVLEMRCEKDFKAALHHSSPQSSSQLQKLF